MRDVLVVVVGANVFDAQPRILVSEPTRGARHEGERAGLARKVIFASDEWRAFT